MNLDFFISVHGGYTEWSNWSYCYPVCGEKRMQKRQRYCTNPTPSLGGDDCKNEHVQTKPCTKTQCDRKLLLLVIV